MTPTRYDDPCVVSRAALLALCETAHAEPGDNLDAVARDLDVLFDAAVDVPRFSVVHQPQGFGGDENPRSFLVVDGACEADDGIAGCVVLAGDWHSARTAAEVFQADPDAYDAAAVKVSGEVRF